MQTYITQLLADLKAAQDNKPAKLDYKLLYPDHPANDPIYGGVMDYMIEWENAPEWTFDKLFGISGEAFPPVEKLSQEQTTLLVDGILELWASFNITTHIPHDDTPIEIIYKVLVNYWKTETVQYISEGWLTIEFCEYDENNCPWSYEFCTCKDFTDEDLNMDTVSDELPTLDDLNGADFYDDGSDDLPF